MTLEEINLLGLVLEGTLKEGVKEIEVKGPLLLLNRKWIKEIEEVEMDKISHKLALLCVKYIPAIVALTEFLATLLSFAGISGALLGCIFGSSILSLVPMYILSYTFKFCKYHRMILNYIVMNKALYLVDYLFILPFTDYIVLLIYMILAGIYLALIIYNYLKYGDRNSA